MQCLHDTRFQTSAQKKASFAGKDAFFIEAERQGFEPWVPFGTPVFKTGAFGRSATSPRAELVGFDSLSDEPVSGQVCLPGFGKIQFDRARFFYSTAQIRHFK